MQASPPTIDAYLAAATPSHRAALQHVRTLIHELVPDAEEVFSYNLPAFKVEGKVFGGFASAREFCAYYPFSGAATEVFADDLTGYEYTKGSIHFQADHPLPDDLIARIVEWRIELNRSKRR